LGESNDPEFSRQPLYILGNILGFIWHVIYTIFQMILMG